MSARDSFVSVVTNWGISINIPLESARRDAEEMYEHVRAEILREAAEKIQGEAREIERMDGDGRFRPSDLHRSSGAMFYAADLIDPEKEGESK